MLWCDGFNFNVLPSNSQNQIGFPASIMLAGNTLDAHLWWNFEFVIPEKPVHLYGLVSYHDPSGNNPFNLSPPKSGSVVLLKPWNVTLKVQTLKL